MGWGGGGVLVGTAWSHDLLCGHHVRASGADTGFRKGGVWIAVKY